MDCERFPFFQGVVDMRFRITVSVLVALLAVVATSAATAQERFGGLAGVVTDSSQAPVPGATVTATNKQTGATRTVVSGADGTYRIPDLEPGRYTVTVELPGIPESSGRRRARPARTHGGFSGDAEGRRRRAKSSPSAADAEKQIDLRSTTVAHNVTAEEFDRMPKARSFQGIALTSPGVNQGDIEGGFQVNGASGAENTFTVDGVNTNSLLYGSSRQDTVFEYLQEVQVKTGGIAAEYGGALGGVISAVTKSGGNRFTGEGHYYYSGNAISAQPGPAAAAQPARRHDRPERSGRQAEEQPQRGRRIDRRPDREGSPVLLRFGVAALHPPDERLPVLERHRAGIAFRSRRPSPRASAR